MERITTGNARLDEVLGGGLIADAISLVIGAPGSGKTILAEQFLFANATPDRPGLYLSTASEPFDKLLRYGQSLEFFDVAAVGESVFYDDLGDALVDEGLGGALERIDDLIKAHRPGIVVIDSFRALKAFAVDETAFRRFLRDLAGRFTALAISAVWVSEYYAADSDSPEFAVVDTVISLETRRSGERSVRLVSVRKHRGSGFLSGDHLYRITAEGLRVFPRLADPRNTGLYAPNGGSRVSTGVAALDESLEDGYWPGSTTLVAGPAGVGKTLMGLHFVYAGGRNNEPGLFVTLQENRNQLAHIVDQFGWSIDDPQVRIVDRSPVDIYIDELVYEVLDIVAETGARRVVIDSLNDLGVTASDAARFGEFIYSLVQRCSHLGVSLMFSYEVVELFRIRRLSEYAISRIADNVILLQYVQNGPQMKRALTVIKSRGSANGGITREFHISPRGITLGEPLDTQAVVSG